MQDGIQDRRRETVTNEGKKIIEKRNHKKQKEKSEKYMTVKHVAITPASTETHTHTHIL